MMVCAPYHIGLHHQFMKNFGKINFMGKGFRGQAMPAHAKAIPKNFTRWGSGDKLIRQELDKLLRLDFEHHQTRPLLTEDGRVRMKSPSTGAVEVGLAWTEILDRAPTYFSNKYAKQRNREEYGKLVHSDFVRAAKQLMQPPHLRNDSLLSLAVAGQDGDRFSRAYVPFASHFRFSCVDCSPGMKAKDWSIGFHLVGWYECSKYSFEKIYMVLMGFMVPKLKGWRVGFHLVEWYEFSNLNGFDGSSSFQG